MLFPSHDPRGAVGDNVPSSDPEGGVLKIFIVKNLQPPNSGADSIDCFINFVPASNNIVGGPVVDYANPGSAAPSNAGWQITAGGIEAYISPAGGTTAMNDGVDDEIRVKTTSGTATCEILYAVG